MLSGCDDDKLYMQHSVHSLQMQACGIYKMHRALSECLWGLNAGYLVLIAYEHSVFMHSQMMLQGGSSDMQACTGDNMKQ